MWQKRPTLRQKRPTYTAKETYKRPTHVAKETYTKANETYICGKRDLTVLTVV